MIWNNRYVNCIRVEFVTRDGLCCDAEPEHFVIRILVIVARVLQQAVMW